ncbi:MAG: hypothetical protein ACI8Z5_002245 [Lentimonas sp.]|jgi:uncharacterized protein YxjI
MMLSRKQYFIKEHAGLLKLSDTYDIVDPETQAKLGQAREEISGLIKALRFLINKSLMPTRISIYEGNDEQPSKLLFSIRRGASLFRPKVDIHDADGHSLGYFKTKAFSIGGAFRVFTPDNTEIALVKGDWKGWNFKFTSGDTELGEVTKKWAGIGKELFTSADNYIISINGEPDKTINTLLLAAGLAVDTIYKEKK